MMPHSARTRFLKRLEGAGQGLESLTTAAGIEAMLAFYADERAEGCDPTGDGDMLLFQWGVNDWGAGPAFEVSITRQLMVAGDENDEPRQLSLTCRFDPTLATGGGEGGSEWCESPGGLAAFRQFIMTTQAVQAVAQLSPSGVVLQFERT
ncbi:MAG: hypothetical protein JWO38_2151 [Gemmataceae bacterium]|nr:hypothetical protein [Gemmataceae bacterium]